MDGISREKVEAVHIVEKMVEIEYHLKWFVLVGRCLLVAPIKKVEKIEDSPLDGG